MVRKFSPLIQIRSTDPLAYSPPVCRAYGAGAIHITDIDPGRLAITETLGATAAVDLRGMNPEEIRKRTDPRGTEITFEAVGSPGTSESAMHLTRPGGRVIAASTGQPLRRAVAVTESEAPRLLDDHIPGVSDTNGGLVFNQPPRLWVDKGTTSRSMADPLPIVDSQTVVSGVIEVLAPLGSDLRTPVTFVPI